MGSYADASDSHLFVNWIGYHGRSDDLARNLGARDVYITGGAGNRLRRYIKQWRETTRTVRSERPETIFVMQPPVLALWATYLSAPKSSAIVADLHTGVFTDPKWKWAARWILRSQRRRGDAVIVTNDALAATCREANVKTFVLDDAVPRRVGGTKSHVTDSKLEFLNADSYVLVPLAYAADEPLEEILAAAARDGARTWVLTGKAPASVQEIAPNNVLFSGFVSRDDYDWLAAHAGVVLACTTEENTMQRAGYEAVSWERPLVTTRTQVLADYFGDAAVFADPDAASIFASIQEAFSRHAELVSEMSKLGVRKRGEYETAIRNVRDYMSAEGGDR